MARVDSTLDMIEQLRGVFRHRDDTDISARVIGRDIPLRVGKTSLSAYAAESFGSIEIGGADSKTHEPVRPPSATSSRQRSRYAVDGGGADVEDDRITTSIGGTAPKMGFVAAGGGFNRPPASGAGPAQVSALSAALKSRSKRGHNPLDKYLEYSGEGSPDGACAKLQVFIPFAETVKERFDAMCVVVLRRATVRDVIGLVMALYAQEGRQPALKPHIEAFELRMVEDGYEADMDLPALDTNQAIARFEFDCYCLVQKPGYDAMPWDAETQGQGRTVRLVKVQWAKEWSKLKIDPHMTVSQLIDTVVLKRKMKTAGIEYILERTGRSGVALDSDELVVPDDGTVPSGVILEFELIRKHCLRESQRARADIPDNMWAVENSLTIHQAKTYLLSKQGGLFGASRMVEFTVDPERISINPFGKSGILGTALSGGLLGLGSKQRQPIQVDIEYVISCDHGEPATDRTVRFTYYDYNDKSQKTYELEANSALEAGEIVDKISTISRSKIGDRRSGAAVK
mmetsp:Transcript_9683/g.24883  ORF Transcript_9683/g.24883 Transcript_9683/m.24883 type:complete len:514 (+) Transcript_9683:119-1660(+)